MAIKDIFSRRYPVDKTIIGRFGRYAIVRGSFPSPKGPECKYGVYIPGAESAPLVNDGIVLTFDEIKQLAALLPGLVSNGSIRESTPPAEYKATMEAIKPGKKAPTRLW